MPSLLQSESSIPLSIYENRQTHEVEGSKTTAVLESSAGTAIVPDENGGDSPQSVARQDVGPSRPAASVFIAENLVYDWKKECADLLWGRLKQKISNIPLE